MITVNEPLIGKEELNNVIACIKSGWLAQGPYVEQFEQAFSRYCRRRFGITVSNGTVALELAVKSLNLKPGEEVIMPAFTIISCAYAIIQAGAKPVLVDADPETWTMDVTQIEQKITKKTRAIMPVHIYGHPCDMDPIVKIARAYKLKIIEDAAEAHGAWYKQKICGCFGDLSCFSFYANKIITCGEGGIILTNNKKLNEKLRDLRNLHFGRKRRFQHQGLAGNYRLTNVQAAIALAQLKKIKHHLKIKRRMGRLYTEKLQAIPGLQLPIEKPWAKNVYWMYGVVLDKSIKMNAEQFARKLQQKGVMTRPFFWPMHQQPVLRRLGLFKGEAYPVAENLGKRGLYLPSGLTLTEPQINKIVKAIEQTLT